VSQQPENEQPGELFYCLCCGHRGLYGPVHSEMLPPTVVERVSQTLNHEVPSAFCVVML
jgi:hypothetical protein